MTRGVYGVSGPVCVLRTPRVGSGRPILVPSLHPVRGGSTGTLHVVGPFTPRLTPYHVGGVCLRGWGPLSPTSAKQENSSQDRVLWSLPLRPSPDASLTKRKCRRYIVEYRTPSCILPLDHLTQGSGTARGRRAVVEPRRRVGGNVTRPRGLGSDRLPYTLLH